MMPEKIFFYPFFFVNYLGPKGWIFVQCHDRMMACEKRTNFTPPPLSTTITTAAATTTTTISVTTTTIGVINTATATAMSTYGVNNGCPSPSLKVNNNNDILLSRANNYSPDQQSVQQQQHMSLRIHHSSFFAGTS